MNTRRHAKIAPALLLALSLAAGVFAVRVIAQAIPPACLPLGCFEAGVESEIWQSLAPFGTPDDPLTCINADPRSALELPRLCGGKPPPLGQFLYPFAVAADGTTIYVSDQFNHRVQAFDFAGTPRPITNPIGNGVPGVGPGQLNAPEGIAVDAVRHIAVADSYNYRIAVFDPDGTMSFGGQQHPIIDTVMGAFTTPTGLAMSPGTTLVGYRVPTSPLDTHRIVVTDRSRCFLYIYDAGFNLQAQIPRARPLTAYPGTACVASARPSSPPPLGVFGSPSGAAIDAAGHIFVADYDNSRVQILASDGTPLGSFGTPPDPTLLPPGAPPPPGSLQGPWGVMVDHTGRVVVTDSANQRIAFFQVDFSTTPPRATFLFHLNSGGTLNGFPTGIAEQTGPDPAGRILVTDTINHRVQRFQLPELAIVRASIDPSSTPATGTFGVAVPFQKVSVVANVLASVTPINATLLAAPAAQPPANPAAPIDIRPGQIVAYSFPYTPIGAGPISFSLTATASGGIAAPTVNAAPVVPCTDCRATAAIYSAPLSVPPTPATARANWYRTPLVVRITATSTNPLGLGKIAYQFTSGPEATVHGGTVHLINAMGATSFIDVGITQEKTSILTFWAINADGSESLPHVVLPLSLDFTPPFVGFNFPPPTGLDALGVAWYNGDVLVPYVVTDLLSGSATPNGTLTFTLEGRGQSQTVTVTDVVGNSATYSSARQQLGGRLVNIDRSAPTFTALPAPVTLELTGPGVGVMTAAQTAAFTAAATDPALADGTAGSGVMSITSPVAGVTTFPMLGAGPTTTPYTFTAKDYAGNSGVSRSVDVTVRDTTKPSFITCPVTVPLTVPAPGATVALPNLSAFVAATDLSGTVTLTQAPAVGTLLGPGSRAVTVTATDPSGNFSTCALTVTVTVSASDVTPPVLTLPAAVTIEATGPTGALVSFSVSAIDAVDGPRPVTCLPPSNSVFPLGTTTVTCSASDLTGNVATGSFVVTVRDTTPPFITVPASVTVSAASPTGAIVTYAASATDLVDGPVPVTCVPASGTLFPIGATTVTCRAAADRHGNVAAPKTFVVTVSTCETDQHGDFVGDFCPGRDELHDGGDGDKSKGREQDKEKKDKGKKDKDPKGDRGDR